MTHPYRYLRPQALECLKKGTLFTECERQPTRMAYGEAILEVGAQVPEVVVLNADVSMPMGTYRFAERSPERTFSFGIAEQNMMAAAAGMATTGLIPFASTYAVFATMRALDQVRNSICYPCLNVKIAASHGGITPAPDGGSTDFLPLFVGIEAALESCTLCRPRPWISVTSSSPGLSQQRSASGRPQTTPSGVPMKSRSPGFNVMCLET